jgi:hypothetical protein
LHGGHLCGGVARHPAYEARLLAATLGGALEVANDARYLIEGGNQALSDALQLGRHKDECAG